MVCRAEARRRGRHVARLSNPERKRGKQMRAWLYYRLSRDEDEELNSLTNQRSIIAGYAEKGESGYYVFPPDGGRSGTGINTA